MALRLIEFFLQEDNRERLDSVLQELKAISAWQFSTVEGKTVVRVLAEAEDAESIIEAIESKFSKDENFRAILMEVTATSPSVSAPEKTRHKNEGKASGEEPSPERVACLELVEKLAGSVDISKNYLLTVVFSVVVAAVGLVRNNTAIVIGAMVIAPFLSPNMALSLSMTLGDVNLARRALKAVSIGLLMALVLSAMIGFALNVDPNGPEIASRAEVGYSDIALALAAGGAGALAFTSGVSAALVGVMVAVAILPPVATAGLLLGSGYPVNAVKALLLALANIICVNLSGVGIFLLQGVRPRFFWESARARRMMKSAAALWIGLLALLILVISLNHHFNTF